VRIGIVGCGYVADFYLATLKNYRQLELAGVTDRDAGRAARFSDFHQTKNYGSLDALLDDQHIELVLNLTNPTSHYAVSRACLEKGKHVYSEKPLAMVWPQAVELVDLAEGKGLQIVSAPCTVLGDAAQTVWKAVRDGRIGDVRLVYAELDDGMVHRENYKKWLSASGTPWPYKDEFEVGCTLEHAGYYASWLVAMFGPAESVTAFAACQLPGKTEGEALEPANTPDFSSGCIQFASGVVARLTCSIIAPHDHSLRLIGEGGTLTVKDGWNFRSPVYLSRWTPWSLRAQRRPVLARLAGLGPRRLRLVEGPKFHYDLPGANRIDFCRGVDEACASIRERRPCRLSSRFSLHINEIVLTLQYPREMGSPRRLVSRCDPMMPMPWATG
jgi:predicted dehydrogenase